MSTLPGGMADEWMHRLAMGGMVQPNLEQLGAQQAIPNPNMGGGLGGMLRRGAIGMQNGLGRLQSGMFGPAPQGVDPEQAKALQDQAMMQMGLGLLAAKSRGQGLGEGLANSYGMAQQTLQGSMQNAFQNAQQQQAQARADNREERQMAQQELAEKRYQTMLEHQQKREEMEAERYEADRSYETAKDELAQKRWEAEYGLRQEALAGKGDDEPLIAVQGDDGRSILVPRSQAVGKSPASPREGALPTEGERVSANYLGRMEAAEKLLGDYVPSITDYAAQSALMNGGALSGSLANHVLSPEGQEYYQAASDWVRAKLRKESGAVIAPEEMAQEIKTYFPVPGDSAEVIKQKESARLQAESGMRQMSGRAAPSGFRGSGGTGSWATGETRTISGAKVTRKR